MDRVRLALLARDAHHRAHDLHHPARRLAAVNCLERKSLLGDHRDGRLARGRRVQLHLADLVDGVVHLISAIAAKIQAVVGLMDLAVRGGVVMGGAYV